MPTPTLPAEPKTSPGLLKLLILLEAVAGEAQMLEESHDQPCDCEVCENCRGLVWPVEQFEQVFQRHISLELYTDGQGRVFGRVPDADAVHLEIDKVLWRHFGGVAEAV